MASPKTVIKKSFPKLTDGSFEVTSPDERTYNCVAWAAEKSNAHWWPRTGYYWPPDLPRVTAVEAFVAAFGQLGYEPCNSFDLEAGFDKVAIYTNSSGRPTHMARQLPDGTWTSKLGMNGWDIAHKTLGGMEGAEYGTATLALKRKVPGT